MNTPSASTTVILSEIKTLDEQIGVCYHCREMVWDGQSTRWYAPHACPHCQLPLTLVLLSPHLGRTETTV